MRQFLVSNNAYTASNEKKTEVWHRRSAQLVKK